MASFGKCGLKVEPELPLGDNANYSCSWDVAIVESSRQRETLGKGKIKRMDLTL